MSLAAENVRARSKESSQTGLYSMNAQGTQGVIVSTLIRLLEISVSSSCALAAFENANGNLMVPGSTLDCNWFVRDDGKIW